MTKCFRICRVAGIVTAVALTPIAAHAQTVDGGAAFGNFVRWILGPGLGLGIVSISAALVGVGWMAGHRDVQSLVHFGIGAVIFSSALLIGAMFVGVGG